LHQAKITKDGIAIAADAWGSFLQTSTDNLHQAQSLTDVGTDPKTGNLSAIINLPNGHPDISFHGKPLRDYLNHQLSAQEKALMAQIRNPVAIKLLSERTQNYRPQILNQIAAYEAKLVEGKRYSLAIDSLGKFEKAAYAQPHLIEAFGKDFKGVINSLTLLPEERDKLARLAQEKLGTAAALGTLHQSPQEFLNNSRWKDILDPATHFRLQSMAESQIRHNAAAQSASLHDLSQAHFASLLETGKGIDGYETMVENTYGKGSRKTQQLLQKHALYQQAGMIHSEMKQMPLSASREAIKELIPEAGDHEFHTKQQLVKILDSELTRQTKQAIADPAAYVEGLFGGDRPQDEALSFPDRIKLRQVWQTQKGIPQYAQKLLMKSEKKDFLKSLETSEPKQLEQATQQLLTLDPKIVQELLEDNKNLSVLSHLYAKSTLFKRDVQDNILQMIPIQKQLFSSQSTGEQKDLEQRIDSNDELKTYSDNRLAGQPSQLPHVEQMKDGVRHLARFYQIERGMSTKTAVNQAVRDLIADTTITPIHGLTVPKRIVKGHGMGEHAIVELDEKRFQRGLSNLKSELLNDYINFDKTATFGHIPNNPHLDGEILKRQREVMNEGHFRLSPDERFLYYALPLAEGFEQPLMRSSTEVWSIPLEEVEGFIKTQDVDDDNNNDELFNYLS
jgi:hypothetical protein